jgi:hypothetical protein
MYRQNAGTCHRSECGRLYETRLRPGQYGSRQQLKDCHESGMKLRREVDALKAEIVELKALIKYISEGE